MSEKNNNIESVYSKDLLISEEWNETLVVIYYVPRNSFNLVDLSML